MTPFLRAVNQRTHKTVVLVCGSQMGKTETLCNIMGHQLDDDPVPLLYIAPTKSFIEKTFEPRFVDMVNNCESLRIKKPPGRREQKTMKKIAGVKTRFGWAGSATELAGEPAALVLVDERDRMENNVDGEGDPKELADARHSTYADGCTVVTSTPTVGSVELEEVNGLEFFAVPPDANSAIEGGHAEAMSATFKLFLQGTRHHWAVPCLHCEEYFIPKFKNLWWKDGASAEEAIEHCGLACPRCGSINDQGSKNEMYERGVFVAPGQTVSKTGEVLGEEPLSLTKSFWVSGLFSPFKSWGERAAKWIKAVQSGDAETIQAVLNTSFGELYSLAGEAPEVSVIHNLKQPYALNAPPPTGTIKLTCGVDVQGNGLYYSVRAWGSDLESWQIASGFLVGSTDEPDVWSALLLLLDVRYGAHVVDRCFIDSGFRTQFVYRFCRENPGRCFPTKGRSTLDAAPLTRSKQDVSQSGKRLSSGLSVWLTNTDYFKRWLHERFVRNPELPGGWHIAEDASEEFCKAMVSEARIVKASGRVVWVVLNRNNHFFDCEVNNVAAAYSLNLQTVQAPTKAGGVSAPAVSKEVNRNPFRNQGGRANWFGRG